MPTLVKYLLLEAPGWLLAGLVALALHRWLELSGPLTATLLGVWIAKDLALYPLLKDAFSGNAAPPSDELVGTTGVVEVPLDPVGLVRLGSELWRAEATRRTPIPCGHRVSVSAVRGLTVTVVDAEPGHGG